jgi:hypothetical protein
MSEVSALIGRSFNTTHPESLPGITKGVNVRTKATGINLASIKRANTISLPITVVMIARLDKNHVRS